jgi:hypothetical protein
MPTENKNQIRPHVELMMQSSCYAVHLELVKPDSLAQRLKSSYFAKPILRYTQSSGPVAFQ